MYVDNFELEFECQKGDDDTRQITKMTKLLAFVW